MSNEKGGLIKKKKKPTIMQPSVPVKKNDMDFGYTEPQKKEKPVNDSFIRLLGSLKTIRYEWWINRL